MPLQRLNPGQLHETLFRDVPERLSLEHTVIALAIGDAILGKFSHHDMEPRDLCVVEFGDDGDKDIAVTSAGNVGLQIRHGWPAIYEVEPATRFEITVGGITADTRQLNKQILTALHDREIARGNDPSCKADGFGAYWTRGELDEEGRLHMNTLRVERYQGDSHIECGTELGRRNDALINFAPTVLLSAFSEIDIHDLTSSR